MKISRRHFLTTAGGALGVTLVAPHILLGQSTLMPAAKGNRVVIVGGGWGGVTTARFLLKHNPASEVVLIEQKRIFTSCPMSNLFIGGLIPWRMLQFDYSSLGRDGIHLVHEKATGIDRTTRTVHTAGGKIDYDYLVLAPGIDYMWEKIPGLWEGRYHIPIAFKPGNEHLHLKRALEEFEEGNLIVGIPQGPIRCPPGPYERIAMMAHHIKKHNLPAKLIVLDANAKPMSKAAGFLNAYEQLYKDIVEYNGSHEIEAVDHRKKVVKTTFDDVNYEMANIIPPMQAGELVRMAGVGERWVDVHPKDLHTKADDRVYVVGDVIGGQPFPKSGFMANSLGKLVARQLANRMQGREAVTPNISNICYSTVDGSGKVGKAIDVSHSFTWDEAKQKFNRTAKVHLEWSEALALRSREWAKGIWFEMLG